jgi:hypothetical protein
MLGQHLQHIPVLHDLAGVIESKDVDPRVLEALWPDLMAVQNDVVAVGENASAGRLWLNIRS